MKPSKDLPNPIKMTENIVRRLGAATTDIQVTMRDFSDVQKFIVNLKNAHKQTANSTLRFGLLHLKCFGF